MDQDLIFLMSSEVYEKCLKTAAVRSLCNHQYDELEDDMFNQVLTWLVHLYKVQMQKLWLEFVGLKLL